MSTSKSPITEFDHLFHHAQEHGSTAALREAANRIDNLRRQLEDTKAALESVRVAARNAAALPNEIREALEPGDGRYRP